MYINKISMALIICLSSVACTNKSIESDFTIGNNYNIDTPKELLKLARRIQKNDSIIEEDWARLFSSEGYKSYLINRDSLFKKDLIKRAMLIAFHPEIQIQRDSIISLPIQLNNDFFSLLSE